MEGQPSGHSRVSEAEHDIELYKLVAKTIEEYLKSKGKDPKRFVLDVQIFEIPDTPVYSLAWNRLDMPELKWI